MRGVVTGAPKCLVDIYGCLAERVSDMRYEISLCDEISWMGGVHANKYGLLNLRFSTFILYDVCLVTTSLLTPVLINLLSGG